MGALTATKYVDGTRELSQPDALGNLFRTLNSKGGQLRQANVTRYHYDVEGNLVSKTLLNGQQWHCY